MVSKVEQRINLPWVEKYRPNTLDDLVSHEDIIKTVSKFIKEDQVPHLLFYGPPGTGKTSTILACARQLYTPTQFSSMVLELNASDDRGIGIVRGQILTFASTRTIFKSGFKLIILDEADAMTMDAQNALRRRADFYIKRLALPGRKDISVRITDIGGLELNGHMLENYLFNSNMIILVYDITNSDSFESMLSWIDSITKFMEKPMFVAIFGNKCDLEHKRAVRLDKTQRFVGEFGLFNFLVSAKTGENVNTCLTDLIARHFGIPLSRIEREKQATVIKAELTPTTPEQIKNNPIPSNSSVCCIQ